MTKIYTGQPDGKFCLPFTFHLNHIERLLLINFSQDPDQV